MADRFIDSSCWPEPYGWPGPFGQSLWTMRHGGVSAAGDASPGGRGSLGSGDLPYDSRREGFNVRIDPTMRPDPNGERENPYAVPELPPLRGYWSRFFPALGRAIRQYRRDMRRQGIGFAAQLWAWFSLFGLLIISLAIITSGAILLYRTLRSF